MGKVKESYSPIYYPSKEAFFADLEGGENQPTYVGLLEIVRFLKLINKSKPKKVENTHFVEQQLSLVSNA